MHGGGAPTRIGTRLVILVIEMEGLLFFIVWHRDMAGSLHVVSLWLALPRIIIGKERCTLWPIPWQLFSWCTLGDKSTVYRPWCEQDPF